DSILEKPELGLLAEREMARSGEQSQKLLSEFQDTLAERGMAR
ncbi:hypothetical protein A2U01_0077900, partial [Trifolium medium]|nr:hypothetical protein [Trifolium medium]